MATSAPNAIATVAGGPTNLAQSLAVVEKPVNAAAKAVRSSTLVTSTAKFLGKALPVTAIVTSTVTGAQIVQKHGYDALVETKAGRSATIGALGGALFLVPAPPVQLAAAGVLGVGVANHFDALAFLDQPQAQPRARGAKPLT